MLEITPTTSLSTLYAHASDARFSAECVPYIFVSGACIAVPSMPLHYDDMKTFVNATTSERPDGLLYPNFHINYYIDGEEHSYRCMYFGREAASLPQFKSMNLVVRRVSKLSSSDNPQWDWIRVNAAQNVIASVLYSMDSEK